MGNPLGFEYVDVRDISRLYYSFQLIRHSSKMELNTVAPEVVARLMRANLLSVFNERSSTARVSAIAATYNECITFYEPDQTIVGHSAVDVRVKQLLAEHPTSEFRPDGAVFGNHNLGMLAWHFGPAGKEPAVKGIDIAMIQGEKIETLYTLVVGVSEVKMESEQPLKE